MRSLSLRGCGVGAAGARALAAAIASTETLRLGENTVGDDGAVSLAEALANASSLATLDVSSNGVGAVGAAALVREATTLRELSLFGNEAIGDAGLAAATEAAGAGGAASLAYLDAGGCGATEIGLVALCETLIARADVFPKLETLVVGGNPGTQSDAWEPALGRLRDARPGLDVAWRAADAGDSKEEREAGERLLAQHREQQAGLPRRRREGEGDARALEYRSPRRRAFGAMTILTISRAPKEYIARHSHRNVHPHRSLTHWVENRHASPRSCLTAMESRVS